MKKLPFLAILIVAVCCSFFIDRTFAPKTHAAQAAIKSRPADTPGTLPRRYMARKFLNDVSGMTDLRTIPGNIVTYNPKDSSYNFRTLKPLIKDNKLPVTQLIDDGTIFSAIITPKTGFNGSYLINKLYAAPNEVMELTIRDEALVSVPDSLVDVAMIKLAANAMTADEKMNSYYVKAVTATAMISRKYTLTKFSAGANSFYVTVDGKVYGTPGKSSVDRVVSMWLLPLQGLHDAPGR
jgi:hypothetical protein